MTGASTATYVTLLLAADRQKGEEKEEAEGKEGVPGAAPHICVSCFCIVVTYAARGPGWENSI